MAKRIFLSGFMGAGKTTVGALLARELGWEFVDLDAAISSLAGRSVGAILRELGEERFRGIETNALGDLVGNEKRVLSLGGGTLLSELNRRDVEENGILVYLKASLSTLAQRLQQDPADRPLLGTTDLTELFEQRRPGYELAEIQVVTDDRTPVQVVSDIIEQLKQLSGEQG